MPHQEVDVSLSLNSEGCIFFLQNKQSYHSYHILTTLGLLLAKIQISKVDYTFGPSTKQESPHTVMSLELELELVNKSQTNEHEIL